VQPTTIVGGYVDTERPSGLADAGQHSGEGRAVVSASENEVPGTLAERGRSCAAPAIINGAPFKSTDTPPHRISPPGLQGSLASNFRPESIQCCPAPTQIAIARVGHANGFYASRNPRLSCSYPLCTSVPRPRRHCAQVPRTCGLCGGVRLRQCATHSSITLSGQAELGRKGLQPMPQTSAPPGLQGCERPPLRLQRTTKSSENTVRTGVFVGHAVRYSFNSVPKPVTHSIRPPKNTVRTEVFVGQGIRWTRGARG
jgi:hypothetical protein